MLEEFYEVTRRYLQAKGLAFDEELMRDLFAFQKEVMAHPDADGVPRELSLLYNWPEYFRFAFILEGVPLRRSPRTFTVIDPRPSKGSCTRFLSNHFDIRGIPPFNDVYTPEGEKVFPLMELPAFAKRRAADASGE